MDKAQASNLLMSKPDVRNSMNCRRRKTLRLLSAGLVAAASSAVAQQPTQPAPPPLASATVEGVAVDSLHRGFLRGAMLMVEGSNVTAATDSLGRRSEERRVGKVCIYA